MSLAASTAVDSSFHPSFLTCLSMNFDLDKLKIHIFHRKICSVVKDMPIFNGFIIDENIINQIYSKTFDLIQLVSSNLSLKLKFMIEDTHLMVSGFWAGKVVLAVLPYAMNRALNVKSVLPTNFVLSEVD